MDDAEEFRVYPAVNALTMITGLPTIVVVGGIAVMIEQVHKPLVPYPAPR